MKLRMRSSRAALSTVLLCSAVACQRAVAGSHKGVDWSRAVGEGVKTIRLNIESPATIRLVASDGVVGVSEMVYEGFAADPVSVETAGAVLAIRQERGGKAQAVYTLSLPKGMDVEINGGILNLTGELSAAKLDIHVDMLASEAGIAAKSVVIQSGMANLSGRIEAPTVSIKASMISDKARLEVVADEAVSIDSKMGRMDVSITRSRRVDVVGGMVSGSVEVPGRAFVNSSGDMKIIRKS